MASSEGILKGQSNSPQKKEGKRILRVLSMKSVSLLGSCGPPDSLSLFSRSVLSYKYFREGLQINTNFLLLV